VSGRDGILTRIRDALREREAADHPGTFESWRTPAVAGSALDRFEAVFTVAGGEVVRLPNPAAATAWMTQFGGEYSSATLGTTLPAELSPDLPQIDADRAELGVSMARGAVAETGSLLLDARDGRRTQLLAPTHVVFVHAEDIHVTLLEALNELSSDLPSAIGLHSGPSKSADIGQILVKGVHGPGRIIAGIIAAEAPTDHAEDT
jgi:L-lactate dehydrogenase complex protein LldG